MTDPTQKLAAHYVEAIEFEKIAWRALQEQPPGSRARAQAWAAWAEAISQTNQAWRQLSSESLSRPRRPGSPDMLPIKVQASPKRAAPPPSR